MSQRTRNELVEIGVSPERIRIIYNGAPEALPVDDTKSDDPTILVLGRLVPHKQVEHVLRAAGRLRVDHPGLRVRVVGDGWWAPSLQSAAEEAGVADATDFLGFVDEAVKHQEIARSWVMALPSVKEGWGIVVMEAAGHGVPTVAYREAGGVTESIDHEQTGLLAENEEHFVAHLGNLLGDHTLRKQLGENARAHAARYSWRDSAAAFADTLAEVVGASGMPVGRTRPVHVDHDEAAGRVAP